MTAARRWGFRARLTALIAGVFILGGAVLLTVQYVLVQQLLTSGVTSITSGCGGTGVIVGSLGDELPEALRDDCEATISGNTDGVTLESTGDGTWDLTVQQTAAYLSDEVLSGLLLWSIVVLLLFAGLAVLAAWWLSKRSLDRIARITETTRDITREDLHRRLDLPGPTDEVKELGDTIDGMLDRLDEAFTRQERFVAAASHELRTPLTITRTALEIPLEQGRFAADIEPDVRRALAANHRSERVIAALLALARTATMPAEPSTETADLASLAHDALDRHRSEAERHDLAVVADVGEAVAAGDETLVGIAVGNLIENAIRHNRAGGTVRITTIQDADTAELIVDNDGRELTEGETSRLTEPFHRGDETRLAGPGTGLGLTLTDTIAGALGGHLTLAPRLGGGLTARLILRRPRTTFP